MQEPKPVADGYDRDYEYKQYRKLRKEQRHKVELVTMDIFRNMDTDSEMSSPDERPDRGEDSSPDDLDWNDSEREDDQITYQPSYRKLNFDYVV